MSDAPLILGVSGLRGIVGESLTPDVATTYAAAFGHWLVEHSGQDRPRVIIGRDGRAGGESLQTSVVRGLAGAGCRVDAAGVCTTPTVGFEADKGGYAAGVVLTASHNPQQWNGIKLLTVTDGVTAAPNAKSASDIIAGFNAWNKDIGANAEVVTTIEHSTRDHVEHIVQRTTALCGTSPAYAHRVVTDSVNSSGGPGCRELAKHLGLDLHQLFDDGSGIFPHTPEPTRENLSGSGGLCDAVPGLKADIGFAQDPDADRLAIIDERGHYIGEEYTLALCAMSVLDAMGDDARDTVLVANLSTSRMIDDVAAKYGARVERTPVGEANVVERMLELKAAGQRVALGGEGNGGVIWPEVVYVRDSLGSMALTLALMARTGKSVSQLVQDINALSAGGSGYAIVKRKVNIASKADAEPAVQAVTAWAKTLDGAKIDTQDGVRVDFDTGDWAGSWVHVRASNTEPIMRLICESPTEATAASVLTATEHAIAGT